MAPLDAWYAGRWGSADFDELAEMFTIEPLPALRISGIAYLLAQTVPISAMRRICSNVSLSISSTWLSLPLPTSSDAIALFTSVVKRPYRSTVARDRAGDLLLDAVVGADVQRLTAGLR